MSLRPRPHGFDPGVHRRYLDYRDKHAYFGHTLTALLTAVEFTLLDAEFFVLQAIAEADRDDEQARRLEELASLLFRD